MQRGMHVTGAHVSADDELQIYGPRSWNGAMGVLI